MKYTGILAFLLINCIVLNAQQDSVISFSLNEAQDFALTNSYESKTAELDIKAAKKTVWATTAIGLPQVNASGTYQHIPGEIPELDFGMDSLFNYIFGSLSSLGQPPPDYLVDTTGSGTGGIAEKNNVTYDLTVSQLIFSGEYIVGLQAARTYLQISELNREKSFLDIKENIATSYYSILVLENNLKITESSAVNIKSILDETKAMYKQGFIEQTDVDQFELTYRNIENIKNTIERQLNLSYGLFKIQLGIDTESEIRLTETLEEIIINANIEEAFSHQFIIEDNIDYKTSQNMVKISKLNKRKEMSQYLPTVAAFYSYTDNLNKPAIDFTINHIIGVNVEIPLFTSGMRHAEVQHAKIELQKSELSKEYISKNLKIQAQQAKFNFESALEKYENEKYNIGLSQRILNKTTIKYKEGMSSSLDLTQANNQYLSSNSNYMNAVLDLLVAKLQYDKIVNNL